jgi:hypothetical protein
MPSLSMRDLMKIMANKHKRAYDIVWLVVVLSTLLLPAILAGLFFIPLPDFGRNLWERYLFN